MFFGRKKKVDKEEFEFIKKQVTKKAESPIYREEEITILDKLPEKRDVQGTEHMLITYDLKNKKSLDKVKFAYALQGRGKRKGFLEKAGGEWLARGCILVPSAFKSETDAFFSKWKVVFYSRNMRVLN